MRRYFLLVIILLLGLLAGGCRQEPEVVVVTATASPATPTAEPPTATVPPATAVTATATTTPAAGTATPQNVDRSIRFEPGATSATVGNRVAAGTRDRYTLRAQAGQTMRLELSAADNNASLEVYAPGGELLSGGAQAALQTEWEGVLPASGDYTVFVRPVAGDADYHLVASISALEAEATRIRFEPGTFSTTVEGTVSAGARNRYVLDAQSDQTMRLELTSGDNNASLVLEAPDGQILAGGPQGAVVDQWEGTLPQDGDYLVSVRSTVGDATYRLLLIISPLPEEASRIRFEPGASSATLTGQLAAGGDLDNYVFAASAGQAVIVSLSPYDAPQAYLKFEDSEEIWGSYDGVLEAVLPVTGDYVLTVWTPNAAGAVDYEFTITIESPVVQEPERIRFAAGANSAMLTGDLAADGDMQPYIFGAAEGQTVTVELDPAEWVHAYLDAAAGEGHWASFDGTLQAVLPHAGDYVLAVWAPNAAGAVMYEFTITIE